MKRQQDGFGAGTGARDEAERLRALALRWRPDGRAQLRLGEGCALTLRRLLARAGSLNVEDEALRRLRQDAGRVEECLRQAREGSGARTLAVRRTPRVLLLARALVDGGERSLTKERLLRGVAAFDDAAKLEIRELRLVPAALRIALCEALCAAASEVLAAAKSEFQAERWVYAQSRNEIEAPHDSVTTARARKRSRSDASARHGVSVEPQVGKDAQGEASMKRGSDCENFSVRDGDADCRVGSHGVRVKGKERVCSANVWRPFAGMRMRDDAAFLARALRLCAELERPELCERLARMLDCRGERRERLAERARCEAAELCLRLDNLMKLKHLLDGLNWQACFEELCGAEQELRDDPAGVYAGMDEDSRARTLAELEALARHARASEIVLARRALAAARRGLAAYGAQDPRATVCWYLCEDEGRATLCRELGAHVPRRLLPDPRGWRSVALVCGLCAVALALILWGIGKPWLMFCALPLAWVSAWRVLGRLYPRFVKPRALLKMEVKRVPDAARTLVALPVLLSGEGRAREMAARMASLGCLERDENIDYLLLGDFRDGDSPSEPEDERILCAARAGIAELNAAAGREKYFYLHRARTLRERDERWMGENRKRGALAALNRLILNQPGATEAFAAEGARAGEIAARGYRYVVTLDADTEYLPGTLQKLIGAMLHPLNRREVSPNKVAADGRCSRDGANCMPRAAARKTPGARDACRTSSAASSDASRAPMPRGCAVLQPDMRLTAEAAGNAWVELSAGEGGVDGYPTSVSDFYQDMTGRGCFAGKGIYDVRAFAEATEGALGDDILSHDLIEGILSGAGLVSDVRFYDGCPQGLGAELTRLNRWTRGDWQLLPLLCSKLRLGAAERMKLVGNLLRSLYAPALLALMVLAIWTNAPGALALGLAVNFFDPLLNLFLNCNRKGGRCWKAALLQLATLPATAACQADAIARTIWRLTVSHRHLMEWVPAADASGGEGRARLCGRVAALLTLPGLARVGWAVPVLALFLLFWVGADWAGDLSCQRVGERAPLSSSETELLRELARRTWRFFEEFVPEDGNGLPPDNVQLDPPIGAAERTSPTNVGMYLLSCLAARELGFIDGEALRRRLSGTVGTLERLEKWRGQLYNWYDTRKLEPLRPRYVSAVDSGNLAVALLLCAKAASASSTIMAQAADQCVKYDSTSANAGSALPSSQPDQCLGEHTDGASWAELARRLRALAEGMDLAALYDGERELFRIGMDVDGGRLSESHYDLYASEARILSFAAMMLGQVPAKHWSRLNRACVRAGRGQALLSWSGTMFEYLMPELLLRSPANSLAGRGREGVAACQIRHGRRNERPWGVSESGYYAFDAHLNYQYRAFGLPELALSGEAEADVVAPYAAALALCCEPRAAAENLRRMCALGWADEYGLYEAADYTHSGAGIPSYKNSSTNESAASSSSNSPASSEARLVRSHMAHHQGMALCAICNALRGDALAKRFLEIPEARALRLLLQERPGERPGKRARRRSNGGAGETPAPGFARGARTRGRAADVHLLHGAQTSALVTARGAAFAWSGDVQLNRFSGELTSPHEGMYVHLAEEATGACTVIGRGGRGSFDAGVARFRERFAGLNVELKLAISPEDGTLYEIVELENPGDEPRELRVALGMAAALAPVRDMRAHAIFQNLFVEGERLSPRALALRRRPRTPGEELPELICAVSGGDQPRAELRLDRLIGRLGSLGQPGGLNFSLCEAKHSPRSTAGDSTSREEAAPEEPNGDTSEETAASSAPSSANTGAEPQVSACYGHDGLRGKRALLDPGVGLEVRVRVEPGSSQRVHFALALVQASEREIYVARAQQEEAAERALRLACARARTALLQAGLDGARYSLYQRAAALLLDAGLRRGASSEACEPVDRHALWSMGLSGELPILLVELSADCEERPRPGGGSDCVRETVRLHAFYREMGLASDLVLLDARGGSYRHNLGGELSGLLAASALTDAQGKPGGVHLLDAATLSAAALAALRRAAAIRLDADSEPLPQLRGAVRSLAVGDGERFRPLPPARLPEPDGLRCYNGYGGILGDEYHILLRAGREPWGHSTGRG